MHSLKLMKADALLRPISTRLRTRLLSLMRGAAERQAVKRMRQETDLWNDLTAYLKASRSTGCNYLDYWHLYHEIRSHRPTEILECGTGVSTIVIASAMMKNGRGGCGSRLTSLEELPQYFEQAVALLPEKFKPWVEIVCSPRTEDCYGLFRGVRYRDVPLERNFDFVFVDGPDYRAPSDGMRTFDFDFIHVLRHADHKIRGLVDKRVSTCYALQKLLGPEIVRYDARLHLGFIGPCSRLDLRDFSAESPSSAFADSFSLGGNSRLRLNFKSPQSVQPAAAIERKLA